VICISLSIGLGAFSMSGFLANTLDIAPQFSSIVLGISNSIATLPGLISPVVTGYILDPHEPVKY
jgi:ACS family sodium-dependent inorganic phosphate cotransporter